MAKKKRTVRRKKATPQSVGLGTAEVSASDAASTASLASSVEDDGGAVLGTYRDPFGGTAVLIVALPIDRVEPTPFQRDPSDAHIKRQVMGREVVVAITRGKLDFGPWEQIFYGEFDGRRAKRVLIKVIGD